MDRPMEDRPVGRSRQTSGVIAMGAVISLLGISMAISGGRAVRAAIPEAVSGTGVFVDESLVSHQVLVSVSVDGSGAPFGYVAVPVGPDPSPSFSSISCLQVSGSHAVVGFTVNSPAVPIAHGVLFVTDNGPVPVGGGPAPDTLWINPLSSTVPASCSDLPTGTETAITYGDFTVISQAAPVDANLDGIVDTLQPSGTSAGSFVDASLPLPTYGSIVSTAGLPVQITDAPNPEGVLVTVGTAAPGTHIELNACGFTLLFDPGTTAAVTCGSVTLRVSTGAAKVILGGGIASVSVLAGGTAKVTDAGGGSFNVSNLGAGSVSLTVDGTTTAILAGAPTIAKAWDFVGFSQPVDNTPTLNRVKAGQAIPIKWRILNSAGAPVTNLSSASLTVTTLDCSLGATFDQIEETATTSSGLRNLGNGYYQLNWKSPTTYAASCKTLHLNIGDGVSHDAVFQFTK